MLSQVVKKLLALYSENSKYKQAYELADQTKIRLQLLFSIESNVKLAELEETIKGYAVKVYGNPPHSQGVGVF